MRVWRIFVVALRQKLRDRFGLALTVLTAPLFVVAYYLFFSDVGGFRWYVDTYAKAEAERARAKPAGTSR